MSILLQEYQTGIDAARRLLEIDSLNEEAHRSLILLFLMSGQTQAALRQYRMCENILQKELGVSSEK